MKKANDTQTLITNIIALIIVLATVSTCLFILSRIFKI